MKVHSVRVKTSASHAVCLFETALCSNWAVVVSLSISLDRYKMRAQMLQSAVVDDTQTKTEKSGVYKT
jgi:hypothetical protein